LRLIGKKRISTKISLFYRLITHTRARARIHRVNDNLIPWSSPQELLSPIRDKFRANFYRLPQSKLRVNGNLVDESATHITYIYGVRSMSSAIFRVKIATCKSFGSLRSLRIANSSWKLLSLRLAVISKSSIFQFFWET